MLLLPSKCIVTRRFKSATCDEEDVIFGWQEYLHGLKDLCMMYTIISSFIVNVLYSNVYIDGRVFPNEDPASDDIEITLEDVFSFATGSDHEPLLGFANKPEICFVMRKERSLPHASTCDPTLYLPLSLNDPDEFCERMLFAIIGGHGFGLP